MRRALLAIVLTVAGLFFLLDYKSSPIARGHTSIVALPPLGTSDPQSGSEPPPTSVPAGGDPTSTLPPPTSARSTPVPTTARPSNGTRTVTGPPVNTEYGDVQVAVTLSGTRITNVTAVLLPKDRARSRAISQYAAPILHDEVLAAQGAHIDTVSGASYTTEGYAQSLQAALDVAHG